nr:UMP kinase [Cyclobacteriaceae bacterium]
MKYKRILIKLSGESLQGNDKGSNIDPAVLEQYSEEIKQIKDAGVEVSIVIGGGNIFRGGQADILGID